MSSYVEFPEFNYNNPFTDNLTAVGRGGASLVLDSQRGELVKASSKDVGGFIAGQDNSQAAEKAAVALKNHSEAEKRRRERINGHLATLRNLIPGTSKMDKASLLAKVITHLKEVETKAIEATRGLVIPLDSDEVIVEEAAADVLDGESSFYIKASVCCDFKHEILSDLKQSLNALQLKLVRVEIGTFGGRMKSTFVLRGGGEAQGQVEGSSQSQSHHKYISGSVRRALTSVIDTFSASQEFSSRDLLSNKRQRVSLFSCANSRAEAGFW